MDGEQVGEKGIERVKTGRLVLKREEGQVIRITHRSGDVITIRTYDIRGRVRNKDGKLKPPRVDLCFHDPERNFEIRRAEAAPKPGETSRADSDREGDDLDHPS